MKVKKWLIPAVVLVIIAVIISVICIIHRSKPSENEVIEKDAEPLAINIDSSAAGISVVSANSISGMFVEDGSDDVFSSVFALDFRNDSERTLQYAKLTLTAGKEKYVFEISTIPPGETVRAMEINRREMPDSLENSSLKSEGVAWFAEEPEMHKELISVEAKSGTLQITNVSDKTLTKPIYVYYKNYIDGVYVGGITYRAGTQEKIKPGKSVVINAGHFDPEASKLMFVTYGS